MREPPVQPDELQAAIEARKELGAEMEPALVEAFVERIERRLRSIERRASGLSRPGGITKRKCCSER